MDSRECAECWIELVTAEEQLYGLCTKCFYAGDE